MTVPVMTTLSATFAPAGTGKLPGGSLSAIVLAEGAAAGEDAAADALWLVAAGLAAGELAELAVVTPAVHAATDRVAAPAASASALERKVFIRPSSIVLVITSGKARRPPCRAYRGCVANPQQRARFWHGQARGAGCSPSCPRPPGCESLPHLRAASR